MSRGEGAFRIATDTTLRQKRVLPSAIWSVGPPRCALRHFHELLRCSDQRRL